MNIQKSFRSSNDPTNKGTLYLVATPIGNLEDITFRAIRTLKEVDLIAAEDTRQTRKLLTHFEISTRTVSYHEHNKQASGPELVRLLAEGQSIALVSDAGLPAISDPGYELVMLAVAQNITVVPIPGANAALSALIASALPTERFTFLGFLPREKKDMNKELERWKSAKETLLFYESPHRVVKTLERMSEVWGADRNLCLARELTKKYEEFIRGTVAECLAYCLEHPPQGEYCFVVEGDHEERSISEGAWWELLSLAEHVERYIDKGSNKKEAMKLVAVDRDIPKRDVYQACIE
ncbi:Ribosomal RNA small subunit methyltransferase I [compost metagenome]